MVNPKVLLVLQKFGEAFREFAITDGQLLQDPEDPKGWELTSSFS